MITINFYFIRLWVENKTEGTPPEPDQIGYINVVPEMLEEGGIFSKPVFESFDVTLQRLNADLAINPVPGNSIIMYP